MSYTLCANDRASLVEGTKSDLNDNLTDIALSIYLSPCQVSAVEAITTTHYRVLPGTRPRNAAPQFVHIGR